MTIHLRSLVRVETRIYNIHFIDESCIALQHSSRKRRIVRDLGLYTNTSVQVGRPGTIVYMAFRKMVEHSVNTETEAIWTSAGPPGHGFQRRGVQYRHVDRDVQYSVRLIIDFMTNRVQMFSYGTTDSY